MGREERGERIVFEQGVELWVDRRLDGDGLLVELAHRVDPPELPCVLHWGLVDRHGGSWRDPDPTLWPEGTRAIGDAAVQTALSSEGEPLRLRFGRELSDRELAFVLYLPTVDRWINRGGRDYRVSLAPPRRDLLVAGLDSPGEGTVLDSRQVDYDSGSLAWRLSGDPDGAALQLQLITDLPSCRLHWGLAARRRQRWSLPEEARRPPGSEVCGIALETPFVALDSDQTLSWLELSLDGDPRPRGLAFVLRSGERWLKDDGDDFHLRLTDTDHGASLSAGELDALQATIVEAENERGSWTLMHRFQLCRELLDEHGHDADALAALYCWLRFSTLRQLDWQRNYNTKPRELAHAQDRLTQRVAEIYAREPALRSLARLMLTTLGRGADGQRVRDEILEIMHRHKIKETTGHFMEEWHQKLHNNTTPDDIAICEAYLSFLRTDGDVDVFYDALAARGVTKKRLASYERPIVTDPDFNPGLKEGLIASFEHYLLTLKRVHRGTDLQVAVEAAEGLLPEKLEVQLFSVLDWQKADATDLPLVTRKIISLREKLKTHLLEGDHPRDLLFLDIALEKPAQTAARSRG
jgi:alpha-glucan,water dikinase